MNFWEKIAATKEKYGQYLTKEFLCEGLNCKLIRVQSPIEIPEEVLIQYADDWNGIYGGMIMEKDKIDNIFTWTVKVYLD